MCSKYKKGSLTKDSYTSDFLNIQCIPSEDFSLATEEQLQKVGELLGASGHTEMAIYNIEKPINCICLTVKEHFDFTIDERMNTIRENFLKNENVEVSLTGTDVRKNIAGEVYKGIEFHIQYPEGTKSNEAYPKGIMQSFYMRVQSDYVKTFITIYQADDEEKINRAFETFTEY